MKRVFSLIIICLLLSIILTYDLGANTSADPSSSPVGDMFEHLESQATIVRLIENHPFPGSASSFEYLLDKLHIFAAIAGEIEPAFEGHRATMEGSGVYSVTDSRRVRGQVEVVYSAPQRRVYFGEGGYRLFWNMRFSGRGIAVVDFREDTLKNNRRLVATIRFYGKVDSAPLSALVKIVNLLIPQLINNKINLMIHATERVMEEFNRNPQDIYHVLIKSRNISIEERE
ncbi:MAG: hypothetical protein ACE5GF_06085, partial [Thermodesulfobacteriota bacterium]